MQPPIPSFLTPKKSNFLQSRKQRNIFILVTSVFFMWGLMTTLNDILIPHLKHSFNLNYTESLFIQFTFFGAYFLLGIPAGWLVSKIGYKNSIVCGLLSAALGAFMFLPASHMHKYMLFLSALFVLAGGITLLQVSANPYISLLGSEKTASSRLNLAQMFNSLGTTIAPWLGGLFILSHNVLPEESLHSLSQTQRINYMADQAKLVQIPYLTLGLIFICLAALFYLLHPKDNNIDLGKTQLSFNPIYSFRDVLKYSRVKLGIISIFLYVGAEVAIGSFLISFMTQPTIGNMNYQSAAYCLSFYWGGTMLGRGISSLLLQHIKANKLLAIFSGIATSLIILSIFAKNIIAIYALISVGLFNSIMFPTIFSLATTRLGAMTPKASSLMIMAIVGGAVIPLLQGLLADSQLGLNFSLILPMGCYLFIMYYGLIGYKEKLFLKEK